MSAAVYNVGQYVDDLRSIVGQETDQQNIVERVRPLAMKLAGTPD